MSTVGELLTVKKLYKSVMNGNNNHPVDDKQHVRSLVDNLVEKVATETENSYITVKTQDFYNEYSNF